MKKYTQMTQDNAKEIREVIQNKLNELKELGLDIKLKNIRYGDYSFNSKIECEFIGNKNPKDQYEVDYDRRRFSLGLEKGLVGKSFGLQGKTLIFKGFVPKKRKKTCACYEPKTDTMFRISMRMCIPMIMENTDRIDYLWGER